MRIVNATCAAFLSLACIALGQKEAPLPKDLPPYGPEKPLAAPEVQASKLDNGLTVWLISEPGFPQIALDLAARGGFAADPADRPGISRLLANTIAQGTATRSAKQVAQEMQAAGGELRVLPHTDFMEISTTILSAKAESGIAVFSDVAQRASFAGSEVELAKRNAADELKQQESQPSFLARRATAQVLFGDHPYHVIAPTLASIDATTPADLRSAFAQRFRPDQALLIAVGDFQTSKMLDMIRASFSAWKAPSAAPPAPVAAPPPEAKHAIFIVPRPGSIQTTLQLAAFGPLRGDPDYAAAQVVNAFYGGQFGSRLTLNIREDKGYTYSPYSYLQPYSAAGTIITLADVRNEVTAPTLNETIYELNLLFTTSPTDRELTTAKRYLVGSEAINLQARSAVASELAEDWIDGLPSDEIGIYGKKVADTTSAEVDAAARKYFPAVRTAIVAVGEEKVIVDALAPFGIPMQTLK
jgi:predicted Zn-dependent peptidase